MKITSKNKSLILSCFAGVGVVLTSYLSARCARKADEKETTKEKALAYAPAIASGCATIVCIGVSTYISGEEIAALTLTCAATMQRLTDYRAAVQENVSQEDAAKIDETFYLKEIERLENELTTERHICCDDLSTFVDSFSGYTFRARLSNVENSLPEVRKLYKDNEALAWCDIFYLLNNGDTIPYESALGPCGGYGMYDYGYGWSKAMMEDVYDNDDGFDFDVSLCEMKDRPGVFVIEYTVMPEPCYMEY